MNKDRRKEIAEAVAKLETVKGELEDLTAEAIEEMKNTDGCVDTGELDDAKNALESAKDDEENYKDNMPENMQQGERYERADEAVNSLSSAIDSIETAVSNLDDLGSEDDWKEAVDNAVSALEDAISSANEATE